MLLFVELGGSADLMSTRSGSGTFDATVASEIGANLVMSAIFSAARLERLAVQAQRNASLPSLTEVFQRLTSAVFAVDVANLVSSPCDAQRGSELLALIATQSVLANAYVSVTDASSSSSASHSLLVRNICKYHVQNVLLPAIQALVDDLKNLTSGNVCVDSQVLLSAHWEGLSAAVSAGKTFMVVPTAPAGPPI